MTDEDKDLIMKLRKKHPSLVTQSMIMDEAADRIEKLLLEITSLNTVIDMLHVAWDQTNEELQRENKRLREANSDMWAR